MESPARTFSASSISAGIRPGREKSRRPPAPNVNDRITSPDDGSSDNSHHVVVWTSLASGLTPCLSRACIRPNAAISTRGRSCSLGSARINSLPPGWVVLTSRKAPSLDVIPPSIFDKTRVEISDTARTLVSYLYHKKRSGSGKCHIALIRARQARPTVCPLLWLDHGRVRLVTGLPAWPPGSANSMPVRHSSMGRWPRSAVTAQPFHDLQTALSEFYVAFDLLHLDGWDLRRCALRDRKRLLRVQSATADLMAAMKPHCVAILTRPIPDRG
jgi:hypothetical protein